MDFNSLDAYSTFLSQASNCPPPGSSYGLDSGDLCRTSNNMPDLLPPHHHHHYFANEEVSDHFSKLTELKDKTCLVTSKLPALTAAKLPPSHLRDALVKEELETAEEDKHVEKAPKRKEKREILKPDPKYKGTLKPLFELYFFGLNPLCIWRTPSISRFDDRLYYFGTLRIFTREYTQCTAGFTFCFVVVGGGVVGTPLIKLCTISADMTVDS
jgi:hypothetical protein